MWIFFILEKKGERENIDLSIGCLLQPPFQRQGDWPCSSGMCPNPESHRSPLVPGSMLNTEPHPPSRLPNLLKPHSPDWFYEPLLTCQTKVTGSHDLLSQADGELNVRQEPLSSLFPFLKTGESWFPRAFPSGFPSSLCSQENIIELLAKVKVKAKALLPTHKQKGPPRKRKPSRCGWFVVLGEGGKVLRYKMRVQFVHRECSIAPFISHVQRDSKW